MATFKTDDGLKYRGQKDAGRAFRGELPGKVQRKNRRIAKGKPVGTARVKAWLT